MSNICDIHEIEDMEIKYGLSVDWHYHPSSELGGDWWGARALAHSRISLSRPSRLVSGNKASTSDMVI